MNGLIEITDDLFDIAWRLRAIDGGYRVYYDAENGNYQVRNLYRNNTLAFIVPFDRLDARTVDYALQTQIKNADKIFDEIEQHNEKLQRRAEAEAAERIINLREEVC